MNVGVGAFELNRPNISPNVNWEEKNMVNKML